MIKHRKKGMTLLEVIIALAISTIILGVMTTMFVTDSNIFNEIDMNSELQLQSKEVEQKLNKIAMESKGVKSFENGKLILVDSKNEEMNHVFELADEALLYYNVERLEDNTLVEGAKSTLARDVKEIIVTFDSNSISYQVKFEINKGGKTETYELKNRVVFRNK